MTVYLDQLTAGAATTVTPVGSATHAAASDNTNNGARADTKEDATSFASPHNRFWFEFTNTFNSLDVSSGNGLTPSSTPNYTALAANAAGGVMVYRSGQVWLNGALSSVSIIGGIRFGIVMLAIDFDNALFWARTTDPTSQGWNSNPLADPDLSIGGLDISSIIAAGLYPVGVLTSLINSFDISLGTLPINVPPTTFTPWGGTPPTPPAALNLVQNARLPRFFNGFTGLSASVNGSCTLLATEARDVFAGVVSPSDGLVMTATETPDYGAIVLSHAAPPDLIDDDVIYVLENNETIYVLGDFSSSFVIPSEDSIPAA